jgi:mRNA interferase YafO
VIRVFKSEVIGQQLGKGELEQLVADFKRYKETGIPAACFGRDVPYDHPHNWIPACAGMTEVFA